MFWTLMSRILFRIDGVDVIEKPIFTHVMYGVCFVALLTSMKVP